jgi:hypothetical protein
LATLQQANQDIWRQLEVPPGDPSVSQRIWETDTLFFNSRKIRGIGKNPDELSKTIACLCLYRFFLEALDLIEINLGQSLISSAQADSMRKSVLMIHRHLSRDAFEVGWLSPLASLGELFGSRRYPRWCQYRFYEPPNG